MTRSGQWRDSTRAQRLPANWASLVAQVRARAGGQCQAVDAGIRCPMLGTDCDHIQRGDDHSLGNLQWLCRDHHKVKTQAEAREAQRKRAAMGRHSRERHPGLL